MALDLTMLRGVAQRVMRLTGGTAVLRYEEAGQLDPIADRAWPTAKREFSVPCVVRPTPPQLGMGGGNISHESMTTTERAGEEVLVAAADLPDGVEPKPGWIVALGTRTFHVVGVTAVKPDGATPIYYTLTGTA